MGRQLNLWLFLSLFMGGSFFIASHENFAAASALFEAALSGKEKSVEVSAPEQSFETILEEVLENNPELKFYEAEIEEAKGSRQIAGLWSNPEIEGSIGQKRVRSDSEGGESTTARGAASDITVTQSLEWPGRIRLRKAIADRDIKRAEIELEQFRALLTARVKTLAYSVTAAKEKAAATSEVADYFRALREVLVGRDQGGLTPLLETRIIEAMELNIQRKASEAVLASQASLLDWNQLRGAPLNTPFSFTKMELKFRPLKKNREELIALARTQDYQVRLRAMELERTGYQVKLSKNERFPAITAGPMISQERAGDRERVIGAAVSIPLPLWDRSQGRIAVSKAQKTQAEASFEMAQREAERRVLEAAAVYETKFKEMSQWQPDSIQHFKEAAELADRHYRLGAVPVSIYIDLQSQYLETLQGLQETKKEALEAASQLELLTGAALFLTDTDSGGAS